MTFLACIMSHSETWVKASFSFFKLFEEIQLEWDIPFKISNVFYDQKSHSFLQYSIGCTSQPYPVWEGTVQGHEYQDSKVIGSHFRGCLRQCLVKKRGSTKNVAVKMILIQTLRKVVSTNSHIAHSLYTYLHPQNKIQVYY